MADYAFSTQAARTLEAIPFDERDAAVRQLLVALAAKIDATGDLEHLGSKYLSTLRDLGATPSARKGEPAPETPGGHLARFQRDAPRE